jgi:tryptophan-rich sensory protein
MRYGFLVLMILLCFGVAGVGILATTTGEGSWYAGIAKPSWNPPGWIFGPVWSALYLAMAVAAWLVFRSAGSLGKAAVPLRLFAGQLTLNGLWSWVFFGWELPGWAFAEILLLWAAILATMLAFFRVSKPAGWLMAPYLAWVGFAAVLNGTIWRMN